MTKLAWRDVSISMLCDEAEISRSTFYSHFATKAELLEQMFCWVESELTSVSSEYRGLDINSKFQFLPGLVITLRKQKKIFQRQQNNGSGIAIASRTRLMIANMMQIEADRSDLGNLFDSRSLTFLSGAVSAVIRKWADENHLESDQELVRILDDYVAWFIDSLDRKLD
ncbi:MAG: helix-turn-helix domain-containing protein [Parasphingorhabdus sp.]